VPERRGRRKRSKYDDAVRRQVRGFTLVELIVVIAIVLIVVVLLAMALRALLKAVRSLGPPDRAVLRESPRMDEGDSLASALGGAPCIDRGTALGVADSRWSNCSS
jgi:prepilin-type N-terminal cleavage/methylation domain-containing protein